MTLCVPKPQASDCRVEHEAGQELDRMILLLEASSGRSGGVAGGRSPAGNRPMPEMGG